MNYKHSDFIKLTLSLLVTINQTVKKQYHLTDLTGYSNDNDI